MRTINFIKLKYQENVDDKMRTMLYYLFMRTINKYIEDTCSINVLLSSMYGNSYAVYVADRLRSTYSHYVKKIDTVE